MDIIRMLSGGFPKTTKTYDFLRDSTKYVVESLALLAGDQPVILEGVVNTNGVVSAGIIIYNGEVFPFKASAFASTVTIKEDIELVAYNEDLDNDLNLDLKEGYVKRFAECGVGGVASFNFSELKRINTLENLTILGEIKTTASGVFPDGWVLADGRSLLKADYPELYLALGDTYGSNTLSFNIPNLRDRVVVGAGTAYLRGATGGASTHQLTVSQMPNHRHVGLTFGGSNANNGDPGILMTTSPSEANGNRTQPTAATGFEGSNQAHNNMQPYIALNSIIYIGL